MYQSNGIRSRLIFGKPNGRNSFAVLRLRAAWIRGGLIVGKPNGRNSFGGIA